MQFVDERVVFAFLEFDLQFRRIERIGKLLEYGPDVRLAAQVLQQARAGVKSVVETEPAFLEENVAAHFAGQQGPRLLHLGLDQGVAGLPHGRPAAMLQNPRRQIARAFDVEQDFRARIAFQNVGGEDH